MWQEGLIALCLVFVIEGIMPFVSPRRWREALGLLGVGRSVIEAAQNIESIEKDSADEIEEPELAEN